MMPSRASPRAADLADLINALGGPGYTEVRGKARARAAACFLATMASRPAYIEFAHTVAIDKDRTEYTGKGRNTILASLIGLDGLDFARGGIIITLYNGDHGWTFRSQRRQRIAGIRHQRFQEQVKRNVDNLLRLRPQGAGLAIRFGGNDTVDLKQVDGVEGTDSRSASSPCRDRSTHLLIRRVVITKDEETQQINEDVSIYSNYQLKDSVWTPLQISREHNDAAPFQIFYDTCKFNPGFSDEIFDKSSLSKQGSQALAKKSKN